MGAGSPHAMERNTFKEEETGMCPNMPAVDILKLILKGQHAVMRSVRHHYSDHFAGITFRVNFSDL